MTLENHDPTKVAKNYQETGKSVGTCTKASLNVLRNSSVPDLRRIATLEGGTGSDDDVEALRKLAPIPDSPTSPVSSPDHKT